MRCIYIYIHMYIYRRCLESRFLLPGVEHRLEGIVMPSTKLDGSTPDGLLGSEGRTLTAPTHSQALEVVSTGVSCVMGGEFSTGRSAGEELHHF